MENGKIYLGKSNPFDFLVQTGQNFVEPSLAASIISNLLGFRPTDRDIGICRHMNLVQTHKCSISIMGPNTYF